MGSKGKAKGGGKSKGGSRNRAGTAGLRVCTHCDRTISGTTPSMLRRHLAGCPNLPLQTRAALDAEAVSEALTGSGVYGKHRELYKQYRVVGMRRAVHHRCGGLIKGGMSECAAHLTTCTLKRVSAPVISSSCRTTASEVTCRILYHQWNSIGYAPPPAGYAPPC